MKIIQGSRTKIVVFRCGSRGGLIRMPLQQYLFREKLKEKNKAIMAS
jgi:hypothetical protein